MIYVTGRDGRCGPRPAPYPLAAAFDTALPAVAKYGIISNFAPSNAH